MTVATEVCYVERQYTGSQTTFASLFRALDPSHVFMAWLDAEGLPVELTRGVHFSVSLVAGMAVVQKIAFPAASVLAPLTLAFWRDTPALQGVDFINLAAYDPQVHENLADAAALRDAELRDRQRRTVTPFQVSDDTVDFRPRRAKAADPQQPEDLVTKAYSDAHTGTAGAERAEAAADRADADAAQTAADRIAAAASAALAEGYAALLESPDYGFVADAPAETRDYGTIP